MSAALQHANASSVTPFLWVGGDLSGDCEVASGQAAELVEDAGITHVLDARLEAHEDFWQKYPDLGYFWSGIDDAGQPVPAEWFERITGWAVDAIEHGGIVLTHCHMGINRGPSAGFAVLLRLGWDPIRALEAIRAARPIANTAYAQDALAWHLHRSGASTDEYRKQAGRLAAWRRAHPVDVVRVIRSERERERFDARSRALRSMTDAAPRHTLPRTAESMGPPRLMGEP